MSAGFEVLPTDKFSTAIKKCLNNSGPDNVDDYFACVAVPAHTAVAVSPSSGAVRILAEFSCVGEDGKSSEMMCVEGDSVDGPLNKVSLSAWGTEFQAFMKGQWK